VPVLRRGEGPPELIDELVVAEGRHGEARVFLRGLACPFPERRHVALVPVPGEHQDPAESLAMELAEELPEVPGGQTP
jgi:hypothetical protein